MIHLLVECIIIVLLIFILVNRKNNEKFYFLSFHYTQCLRGIAILIIMIAHSADYFGTRIFTPLGGIGVAIFLFLSGFGLNESKKTKGLNGFWSRKLLRVCLPYLILQSLSIPFTENFLLVNFLKDISGFHSEYWYISFILRWYIIFYLCNRLLPKISLPVMFLCACIMLIYSPEIEAEQAFSFIVGILYSEYYEKIKNITKSKTLKIGLSLGVLGILFLALKQLPLIRDLSGTHYYNIIQLFIKLPLAIFIINCVSSVPILIQSRFLVLSGLISYELYLIHMKFLFIINDQLSHLFLFWVASFVLAYLFYFFNLYSTTTLKKINVKDTYR